MIFTGYQGINIKNKCAVCEFYKPLIKLNRHNQMIMYCRGKCTITNQYKQRTDPQCKKNFKEGRSE